MKMTGNHGASERKKAVILLNKSDLDSVVTREEVLEQLDDLEVQKMISVSAKEQTRY